MGVYGIVRRGADSESPESASPRPRYSSRPTINTPASSATSSPTVIHRHDQRDQGEPDPFLDRSELNAVNETFGRPYA